MRFFDFFYAWIPLVLVGTVVILALPWLALIALVAVVLALVAALGSLAWAIVATFNGLGHSGKHGYASERAALAGGLTGTAPTFLSAAPRSVMPTPLSLSRGGDPSEMLEEAGINPIDVYEHPFMPAPWSTFGALKSISSR